MYWKMNRKIIILFFFVFALTGRIFPRENKPCIILFDYSHFYSILSPLFDGGNIIKLKDVKEIARTQPLRLYGILALYLNSMNLHPEVNIDNLSYEILNGVDVLVIRTPFFERGFAHPYTKSEVDLIEAFVRDGGSLLILADGGGDSYQKTNVNSISEKFGIHFNNDFVIDKEKKLEQIVKFQLNKT
ncbi:hypothetical protein DRQ09_07785, partial [candidate division KSB1 bacterium]